MIKFVAIVTLLLSSLTFATHGAERSMEASEIYDAAVFGEFSKVEGILKQHPTFVNAIDEYGFTPLHGVVGEHYFDMARLLIANGANVNAKNDSGTTPLHLAAYPEMVEILVAKGADLESRDSSGSTPLHAATEHPELIEVMEKLLELGADVNARNNFGQTALDIAVSREEGDKIELLEQRGARPGNAA